MDTAIQYLVTRLKINALTGLVFDIFLWLVGVPFALLWGILMALLSFVPYVGIVLATLSAVLLALANSGPTLAVVVVLAVTVVNLLVENVVAPSMRGKTLSLSPAVLIVSFAFWIWWLGPIGALIAMPITVLLMITFQQYESTRWVTQLIGTQAQ